MKQILDIKNKRFGKLVALEFIKISNHGSIWLCKCDCGNIKEIIGQNLIRNRTRSCGCERISKLLNKRIGKLTVIRLEYIDNGNSYWLCKCDCGVEKIIPRRNLSKNRVVSCGCTRRDNSIIGKKFGFLTVIKYSHTQSKNAYWMCRYDCGIEKIICGVHLKTGSAKSCGCIKNISQALLTNIFMELLNKDIYNTSINYSPEFLYNKDTNCRQQIDIAILDKNKNIVLAIEYDGQQHFEPIGFGEKDATKIEEKFKNQKLLDVRKNEILAKLNIPFIRIPYTEKLTKENVTYILKQNNIYL
ncbi:MAG: hypothetical protein WC523_06965 [Patescibacteria group bacterium]